MFIDSKFISGVDQNNDIAGDEIDSSGKHGKAKQIFL